MLIEHLNKKEFFKLFFKKDINELKCENDLEILGSIYKLIQPKRCLEFGTWAGESVVECIENSEATIWTINMPFGESKENGEYAYGHDLGDEEVNSWGKKLDMNSIGDGYYRTDSLGFIGRKYIKKDYGNRVCQIYCNSLKWDTRAYDNGFFNTVFIDGGHTKEVVINDTQKSIDLIQSGGFVMWHDYVPEIGVYDSSDGVIEAINELDTYLENYFEKLYWIKDTLLLIGVKK